MIQVGDGGPPRPGTLEYHLQQVANEHGRLTGRLVVQDAAAPDHPLHGHFEWDNARAGHKYRMAQARRLIASVQVQVVTEKGHRKDVRAYVSVRTDRGQEYVPAKHVAESPLMRKMILAEMRADWRSFKERYKKYEEFFQLLADDPDVRIVDEDPSEEVDGVELTDPDADLDDGPPDED